MLCRFIADVEKTVRIFQSEGIMGRLEMTLHCEMLKSRRNVRGDGVENPVSIYRFSERFWRNGREKREQLEH